MVIMVGSRKVGYPNIPGWPTSYEQGLSFAPFSSIGFRAIITHEFNGLPNTYEQGLSVNLLYSSIYPGGRGDNDNP